MSHGISRIKAGHAEKVLSAIDQLRAWEYICDFTIEVGSENFPVHRTVLAACSEYFCDIFKKKGKESQHGGIEVVGITAEVMKQCVEFMYTGRPNITTENVEHILLAADKLKLVGLFDLCLQFLTKSLTVENCFHVKSLFEKRQHMEDGKKVDRFITENLDMLISTNGFLTLKKEAMLKYLTSPNVDHSILWEGIKTWINFREYERSQHFFEILSLNLNKLPRDFLIKEVWPDSLTKRSKPCKELLVVTLLSDLGNLKESITVDNCFVLKGICGSCHHPNAAEAYNYVRLFMMRNFADIAKTEEIVDLTKDEILQIYHSPKTKCSSEILKWKAALRWTKHKIQLRRRYFPDLLAAIKFQCLPLDFIQDVVRSESLVQESNQCREVITDAFLAHARTEDPTTPRKTIPAKKLTVDSTPPKRNSSQFISSSPRKKSRSDSKICSEKKKSDKRSSEDSNSVSWDVTSDLVSLNLSKKTGKATKTHAEKKRPMEQFPESISQKEKAPAESLHLAVLDQNSGEVRCLDLVKMTWKVRANVKVTKGDYHGVVGVDNKLYLLKGKELYVLDAKEGWKKLGKKNTKPTIDAKMVAFQSAIYVIENGSLSYFDLHSNHWTESVSIITTGAGFCVCALDGFLYLLGGSLEPTKARRYDPLSSNVIEIENMRVGRLGGACAAMDGKVYVGGGVKGEKFGTLVERYDRDENIWVAIANMRVQRSNFCLCAWNKKLYAVGGTNFSEKNNQFDSVEVYESSKGKTRWRILHKMQKTSAPLSGCIVEFPKVSD